MEHISHVWPTMAELAADIGKPYSTVAAWKQRGRIPADHDLELIEAAKRRGMTLTLEELARARASQNQLKSLSAGSSTGVSQRDSHLADHADGSDVDSRQPLIGKRTGDA